MVGTIFIFWIKPTNPVLWIKPRENCCLLLSEVSLVVVPDSWPETSEMRGDVVSKGSQMDLPAAPGLISAAAWHLLCVGPWACGFAGDIGA